MTQHVSATNLDPEQVVTNPSQTYIYNDAWSCLIANDVLKDVI